MSTQASQEKVDCNVDFDTSSLAGKTAVLTGGANGLGEAYLRALAAAGVHVCFGDVNVQDGESLAKELKAVKFVPCDVTEWEDQVRLFTEAAIFSPTGKVDFVVANAGVARKDGTFTFEEQEPLKPDLSIVDINLRGVLYTSKLALHCFVKENGTQPSPSQTDSCLILIGSGAAYFDVLRGPQYSATKWAMRGIMSSLRRTAFYYGSRVNMISPWYVRTKILSEEMFDHVSKSGVEFATAEDAGQCLLRILSDSTINGRSLFIAARKWASRGFMDLGFDDLPPDELIQEIQADQIKSAPVEKGLFIS